MFGGFYPLSDRKERKMSRTRKEHTVVPNKSAKIVTDKEGKDHLIVVEETKYYTMTNLRPGVFHFMRETGKEDFFEGHQTLDNITEKEYSHILKSQTYRDGFVVEEKDEQEINEENIANANALSDSRLSKIVDRFIKDPVKMQDFLNGITSDFALKRTKDILIAKDAPSSLVAFCDFRLKVLEEGQQEEMKAPIPSEVE